MNIVLENFGFICVCSCEHHITVWNVLNALLGEGVNYQGQKQSFVNGQKPLLYGKLGRLKDLEGPGRAWEKVKQAWLIKIVLFLSYTTVLTMVDYGRLHSRINILYPHKQISSLFSFNYIVLLIYLFSPLLIVNEFISCWPTNYSKSWQHKTANTYCLTVSEMAWLGRFWLRVSQKVIANLSPRTAAIWRLTWGQRTCFQTRLLIPSTPHWLLATDMSSITSWSSPQNCSQHGSWLPPEREIQEKKEKAGHQHGN